MIEDFLEEIKRLQLAEELLRKVWANDFVVDEEIKLEVYDYFKAENCNPDDWVN